MLDLGFEKDIESILEVLGSRDNNNRSRQHVLLSATLNERVEQLAALSLMNPATVGLEEATEIEVGNGSSRTQPDVQKHERNMGDAGPSDGYTEYRIPSQLVQSFLKGMLHYSILEDSVSLTPKRPRIHCFKRKIQLVHAIMANNSIILVPFRLFCEL